MASLAPQPDPVLSKVLAWNNALDTQKVDLLSEVYAERVCFYGQLLSRSQILDAKRKTLEGAKQFHQQIVGTIKIEHGGGGFVATFLKRSGTPGNLRDTQARLLLSQLGWEFGRLDLPWSILAEEDDGSSAMQKCEARAEASIDNVPLQDRLCEETARGVVDRHPVVKKRVADSIGEFGPQSNDDGSYSVTIKGGTQDNIVPLVFYSVDRKRGALTITSWGEELAFSERERQAVEEACKERLP